MTQTELLSSAAAVQGPTREQLLHQLYEAAELEHNLMCTYLYAAFSLKDGEGEGLTAAEAEAVARWRSAVINVAIDEMGHLAAVWNITAALGGAPRFGRTNFPIDPGWLPASVVIRLAPFNQDVLQHFIHLDGSEPEVLPEKEVTGSTVFEDGLIGFRCHHPGARLLFDLGHGGNMIEMCLIREQDLDIGRLEAEGFDAFPNLSR